MSELPLWVIWSVAYRREQWGRRSVEEDQVDKDDGVEHSEDLVNQLPVLLLLAVQLR